MHGFGLWEEAGEPGEPGEPSQHREKRQNSTQKHLRRVRELNRQPSCREAAALVVAKIKESDVFFPSEPIWAQGHHHHPPPRTT